jgi:hypothetical protein
MSSDLNYPCFQYHQHSNGRDITSLEASQTSSRKRNRKTGAANVEATIEREQQATGDLPTRPPAGSAETDWICCGAPLGDLSHGRGAIDWQMKQEKKKGERERDERQLSAAPASLVEPRGW